MNSRSLARPLGLAAALALAAGLALPGSGGPALRAQDVGGCQIDLRRELQPAVAVLGQRVAVSLSVETDCGALQQPIHLALVVDNSTDMGGPRMEGLRQGVAALAEGLDFSRSKAALLAYHSRVEILAPLSADREAFVEASQRFFPRQGHAMVMGLRAARQLLEQARPAGESELLEVLVLVAGSPSGEGTPEEVAEAVEEARLAREAGMLVVTVAAGGAADYDMLEAMASSSSLFYVETLAGRYPSLFREIVGDIGRVELTGALVSDRLPAELEYAFGSGIPAPRLRDGALTWSYAVWPEEGIAIRYEASCRALGRHASSELAHVRLDFDRGAPVTRTFAVAPVECLPEPSATAPPSPTPSATPSPSPTRQLRPLYLPLLWRGHCKPGRPSDWVLLLDASASMLQASAGGQARLQLALDASSDVLGLLDLPSDRAAAMAFGSRAELLAPLSGSRLALKLGLAEVFRRVSRDGRLDLGIEGASALLAAPAGERQPTILLVTDGPVDAAALDAASRARARGIRILALGLGPELGLEPLRALAGDPDRARSSADGADLARMAADLVAGARCPAP